MSLMVSVDVKQHRTVLRHWSQFVPNMSTDIRAAHEALHHHHHDSNATLPQIITSVEFRFCGCCKLLYWWWPYNYRQSLLTAMVSMKAGRGHQINEEDGLACSRHSLQFSSRWYLSARKKPHNYALHRVSQKFPQRCLWNGSNVRLTDDGPLSPFQGRSSSTFSFHAYLIPTIYIHGAWYQNM